MGREGDGRVDLSPRQGRWSVAGGATPGFRWRISSRLGRSPETEIEPRMADTRMKKELWKRFKPFAKSSCAKM
jgi:hypothetical protein